MLAALAASDADIRRCAGIEDGVKRLECYDAIGKDLQQKADNALSEALMVKTSGSWRTDVRKSPVDDSPSVVISTVSKSSVATKFKTHTPMLIARCVENKTSMYVDFDGAFMSDYGSFGNVTLRADKEPAKTYSMNASTDHNALGVWSGGTAIPMLKSLLGKTALMVRATPHSESPLTFEFDISGMDEAIKPVREACRW